MVPGTVLTTLIARGVYPDPTYGLNNLAIPESLNKQDYWYRTTFDTPAGSDGRRFTLTFNGINYAAEVWLNGARLGEIKGAFARGLFDVTGAAQTRPTQHAGGPGFAAAPSRHSARRIHCRRPRRERRQPRLDGPTFIATEGWDWIPGIRDRNTGLWQDVQLKATGAIRLLDPHVVTQLPLPKTDQAEISRSKSTLENHHSTPTPARSKLV